MAVFEAARRVLAEAGIADAVTALAVLRAGIGVLAPPALAVLVAAVAVPHAGDRVLADGGGAVAVPAGAVHRAGPRRLSLAGLAGAVAAGALEAAARCWCLAAGRDAAVAVADAVPVAGLRAGTPLLRVADAVAAVAVESAAHALLAGAVGADSVSAVAAVIRAGAEGLALGAAAVAADGKPAAIRRADVAVLEGAVADAVATCPGPAVLGAALGGLPGIADGVAARGHAVVRTGPRVLLADVAAAAAVAAAGAAAAALARRAHAEVGPAVHAPEPSRLQPDLRHDHVAVLGHSVAARPAAVVGAGAHVLTSAQVADTVAADELSAVRGAVDLFEGGVGLAPLELAQAVPTHGRAVLEAEAHLPRRYGAEAVAAGARPAGREALHGITALGHAGALARAVLGAADVGLVAVRLAAPVAARVLTAPVAAVEGAGADPQLQRLRELIRAATQDHAEAVRSGAELAGVPVEAQGRARRRGDLHTAHRDGYLPVPRLPHPPRLQARLLADLGVDP